MKELKEIRDSAKAFAREHLAELAREIIEWHDTSLLCDGRLRELSQELKALDDHHSLPMAESFAARAAFEAAAIAPSDAAQAPIGYVNIRALTQLAGGGWAIISPRPEGDATHAVHTAPVAPQAAGDAAQATLTDLQRSHLRDAANLIQKHHPACGYAARTIEALLAAPVPPAAAAPDDLAERIELSNALTRIVMNTGMAVWQIEAIEKAARLLTAHPTVAADAAAPSLTTEQVEQIMEQAQVFASAWSLVGGVFDSGNALETAEQEKANLRTLLTAIQGAAQ